MLVARTTGLDGGALMLQLLTGDGDADVDRLAGPDANMKGGVAPDWAP